MNSVCNLVWETRRNAFSNELIVEPLFAFLEL